MIEQGTNGRVCAPFVISIDRRLLFGESNVIREYNTNTHRVDRGRNGHEKKKEKGKQSLRRERKKRARRKGGRRRRRGRRREKEKREKRKRNEL
jgi:hypothetical protein